VDCDGRHSFSTLNFKTSDNVTIGINFLRFIRRKNEEDLWRSYLRIYGIERISEAGELAGCETSAADDC